MTLFLPILITKDIWVCGTPRRREGKVGKWEVERFDPLDVFPWPWYFKIEWNSSVLRRCMQHCRYEKLDGCCKETGGRSGRLLRCGGLLSSRIYRRNWREALGQDSASLAGIWTWRLTNVSPILTYCGCIGCFVYAVFKVSVSVFDQAASKLRWRMNIISEGSGRKRY